MNTLLITGTIKPLVRIKYCDPDVRRREYMRNLERYIRDTDFDRIIFAENSGYPMEISTLQFVAEANGKAFLVLDVSESADSRTMSTGEAKIMQQALARCPFLQDEDFIWKVSGRVYIRNVNKVLRMSQTTASNIFLYAPQYDSLQTWFCKIKVGDLKKYFLTENAIYKMQNGCIEYAWMDIWKANHGVISMARFPVYPDAEGINSSGQPYTLPKHKWFTKNIMLKMGRFTPNANKQLDRSKL